MGVPCHEPKPTCRAGWRAKIEHARKKGRDGLVGHLFPDEAATSDASYFLLPLAEIALRSDPTAMGIFLALVSSPAFGITTSRMPFS